MGEISSRMIASLMAQNSALSQRLKRHILPEAEARALKEQMETNRKEMSRLAKIGNKVLAQQARDREQRTYLWREEE